jgi:hypothetical protein
MHGDVRRSQAMQDDVRRCATRHGTADLGSAQRKHRFVYSCLIVGACFDVTVLAWRKYVTLHITHFTHILTYVIRKWWQASVLYHMNYSQ